MKNQDYQPASNSNRNNIISNNTHNKSLTIPITMWNEPNHIGPNHSSFTQNTAQHNDIPESSNSRNSPPSNPTKMFQDPSYTMTLSSMKGLLHVNEVLLENSLRINPSM
jgi:hypothetical protein